MARGRSKREIEKVMVTDVKNITQDEFCKKYECAELFYLRVVHKAFLEKKAVEPVESIGIVESFLPDTELMYRDGVQSYMKYLQETEATYHKKLQDLQHKLEIHNINQVEKIAICDMLQEALISRRIYKDAIMFCSSHHHKLLTYCNLHTDIIKSQGLRDSRMYKVKVLVKEFGESLS